MQLRINAQILPNHNFTTCKNFRKNLHPLSAPSPLVEYEGKLSSSLSQ